MTSSLILWTDGMWKAVILVVIDTHVVLILTQWAVSVNIGEWASVIPVSLSIRKNMSGLFVGVKPSVSVGVASTAEAGNAHLKFCGRNWKGNHNEDSIERFWMFCGFVSNLQRGNHVFWKWHSSGIPVFSLRPFYIRHIYCNIWFNRMSKL